MTTLKVKVDLKVNRTPYIGPKIGNIGILEFVQLLSNIIKHHHRFAIENHKSSGKVPLVVKCLLCLMIG